MARSAPLSVTVLACLLLGGCANGDDPTSPSSIIEGELDIVLEMIRVPPGQFVMGDGERDCGFDRRIVALTGAIHVGIHEVTNGEYLTALQWAYRNGYVSVTDDAVFDEIDGGGARLLEMGRSASEIVFTNGRFELRDVGFGTGLEHHPVKFVTWYGAATFCDWLSMSRGLPRAYDHHTWECAGGDPYSAVGFRLPTDAEWEYVARFNDGRIYPWGDEEPHCDRANYCGEWSCDAERYEDGPRIGSNGQFFGFAGNVYEWCNDWLECFLGRGQATNPVGPESGNLRVIRGPSFNTPDDELRLRSAWRYGRDPVRTSVVQGFRCVRSQ